MAAGRDTPPIDVKPPPPLGRGCGAACAGSGSADQDHGHHLRVLDAHGTPTARFRAACEAGEAGYVHSHDNGSALDGPGLRYVVWTTGCLMRCPYCHNPDTWNTLHGRASTADEVLADVGRFAPFLRAAGGGFTVSGGEPLSQDRFALRLLRGARGLGLHTALDTNGFLGQRLADDELDAVDLFLLDIKSFLPEVHRRATGVEVGPVLDFARRLDAQRRPAWVRFVVVPGLTDDPENVAGLAEFVASLGNVERVQVLPFHQMGRFKWRKLGLDYTLEGTPEATAGQAESVREVFRAAGVEHVAA